jgi:hypothetical protein
MLLIHLLFFSDAVSAQLLACCDDYGMDTQLVADVSMALADQI